MSFWHLERLCWFEDEKGSSSKGKVGFAELGRLCLRVAALFSATVKGVLLRKTPRTLYCFPQKKKKAEKIKKGLCPQPSMHKKEDFKDLDRCWRFSWIVDKTERFKIN